MMKRYRPAPFGRAHRIRKRMSHITLVVDSRLVTEEPDTYEEVEEITENQETEE
jgi:large subunit ribosomal protein L22